MNLPFDHEASTGSLTTSPGHPGAAIRGGLSCSNLRRVIAHIDAHLHETITVQTLAELVGLSVPHFARSFNRSSGLPPHRYLMWQRLERARRLLEETDRPASEIALLCGFADQSHLIRRFQRLTALTPHAYRQLSEKSLALPAPAHTDSSNSRFVQSHSHCLHQSSR